MADLDLQLRKAARDLDRALAKKRERLVLAESCTAGLVAASLSAIPGVSARLCGSFVVYREDSKRRWIGVRASTLKKFSAVSAECAEEMARGALAKTPEATVAAAVTGYLGPGGEHVGRVYISVLKRSVKKGVPSGLTLELDIAVPKRAQAPKTTGKSQVYNAGRKATNPRLFRQAQAALATLFLVRSSLEF
jgi:PncC family amidohydrolase